jgi:hypothetical protein
MQEEEELSLEEGCRLAFTSSGFRVLGFRVLGF